VRQCADLNPSVEVIDIKVDPPGPMRRGSIFHYRVVIKGHMTEYSSEVIAFEPNGLIEIETKAHPVLTTKYTIAALSEGVRLDEELTSSLPHYELPKVDVPNWFKKLVGDFSDASDDSNIDRSLLEQEEAELQQQLQAQLNEWLLIVKKYVETQRGKFLA
jgi:hypothetical protein